jgi:hypothetical protein
MPAVFYLRYNRDADKVARLTSITGGLKILSKKASEEAKVAEIVGWHSYADERLVCLCRLDGVLWLRIDDFAIPVNDDVHVFWDLVGPPGQSVLHATGPPQNPGKATVNPAFKGTFRVEKAGRVLLSFEYLPFQEMTIIAGDMTPFITEEDYDVMLLVSRVLEEPGRRDRIFRDKSFYRRSGAQRPGGGAPRLG